ncbi:amino acid adenylation domain-containing protein [Micromonospora nigra]|uniref:Amino acid adenylation domain-containing protein n=1 Tax=Micromonospora nigra TaxID=145857 RepID=A0A1C6T031_9ACTN|nr:non-ribosomal peptide synthetase [Micromonospora nigra]SCL34972.1 amino acid adenylation domain-containing protein [Micromonospora nigra]
MTSAVIDFAATVPPAASRDLLDRLADAPPDRPAVVAGDVTVTFAELRDRAARIAHRLTARGVGPETVVALCLPRGVDLVAALLGTLTAGAAYLPVDPRLPADRRRYLVEDSGADLLVVDDTDAGTPVGDVPRVPVADLAAPGGTPTGYRPVPVFPDTLAYVIYTSGSTGRPKGVEVSRGAVSALLAELEATGVVVGEAGRVAWNASPSFDASVQQWVRLCRGDTVVMLDEQTRTDPALLGALVEDAALTDLDITPSHADPLLEHLTGSARAAQGRPLTLLVGGEAISAGLWDRLAHLVDAGVLRAVNLYGPTECTVDATAGWITGEVPPHIGSVLPGLRLRLLDDTLAPVPAGQIGELYLAGSRVARGYRRRPGLTAERFVADPAGDGGRMYRTGDRCRQLPDGRLEFHGRVDGQVKVRGHRIELGEIEAVLAGHPAVAEVAVVVRADDGQEPALVAYHRSTGPVDPATLRERAAESLPGYMVPDSFVALDRFPLTNSGKLDRAALPAPTPQSVPDTPVGQRPAGRVEELIAAVWSHVLGAPSISADDNFFKLGGHSLLAIKLVSRVRAELGLSLPVRTVYENPKLRDLAGAIEARLEAASA